MQKQINQLLPIEYTRDLELFKVLVGKIAKQNISTAIASLKHNPIFHEEELEHLKRINKLADDENMLYLLCTVSKIDQLDSTKLKEIGITDIQEYEVSKYPPYTKEQLEKFKVPWPLVIKNLGNEIVLLSQNEINSAQEIMKKCITLAEKSYQSGNRFNACILVDPTQKNLILMESMDQTSRKPCSIAHCVMKMTEYFGKKCIEKKQGIK
jgi:hypothetical protein